MLFNWKWAVLIAVIIVAIVVAVLQGGWTWDISVH